MALKPAVLIAAISFASGCNYGKDQVSSPFQALAVESNPKNQSDETQFGDDPFADIDWNSIESTSVLPKAVDFEIGDLVPCPDQAAEFVLEINATSEGKCFYRRSQAFRHYDAGRTNPSGEPGMTAEIIACAMLVNGFASGTFQYVELAPDSVTAKIEWKASQGDTEQEFAGEFTLNVGASGIADAGNENKFEWSLMRSK